MDGAGVSREGLLCYSAGIEDRATGDWLYQTTSTPCCMDRAATIQVFIDENVAAKQALEAVKERHARRWQTKEGIYRKKQQLVPPDVRDEAGDSIMEDL